MSVTTIFCGNPGSGKSALLNSFFGELKFKSGVSFGKGLTTILQIETDPNNKNQKWADTPGLSDLNLRKEAAKEISRSLRLGGKFRIVFICLLDAGRLRQDDVTTMKLVIEAASLSGNQYAIILNKVPLITKKKIDTTPAYRDKIFSMLNAGLPGTEHIILNPSDDILIDEDDALVDPNIEVLGILNRMVPVEIVKPAEINADHYEAGIKKMQVHLENLQSDNKAVQEKYIQTVGKINQTTNQQLQEAKEYQKIIDNRKREHNVRLENIQWKHEEKVIEVKTIAELQMTVKISEAKIEYLKANAQSNIECNQRMAWTKSQDMHKIAVLKKEKDDQLAATRLARQEYRERVNQTLEAEAKKREEYRERYQQEIELENIRRRGGCLIF